MEKLEEMVVYYQKMLEEETEQFMRNIYQNKIITIQECIRALQGSKDV
jgi:hypothetical protein